MGIDEGIKVLPTYCCCVNIYRSRGVDGGLLMWAELLVVMEKISFDVSDKNKSSRGKTI